MYFELITNINADSPRLNWHLTVAFKHHKFEGSIKSDINHNMFL